MLGVNWLADDGRSFSQYPGFERYFALHPPPSQLPSATDQALLSRFQPRLWLPPEHPGPIDFYADYIAQGRLLDESNNVISERVTSVLLNQYKNNPQVVFEHFPAASATAPTAYGYVSRDSMPFDTAGATDELAFVFLQYTFVFRHSGLPAGLDGWQRALLDVVASSQDWHQLDHYTSVTLALDPTERPLAAMFQHHNYTRTYLLGRDMALPADGRIEVDVALGSNELYPHLAGRRQRRAVSFMDGESLRYLVTGAAPPLLSADDITDSEREADYRLALLSPDDAFYMFQGHLGERRLLPGRDGPPGAAYNTYPGLKPPILQFFASYWREDDTAALAAFEALEAAGWTEAAIRTLARDRARAFNADLRVLRATVERPSNSQQIH